MIENGKRYLVTSDHYFVAPDGESYLSAWGAAYLKTTDDVFGFKPARPSTNWFLKIGSDENHIIMAGCQIHYAIRCETEPMDKYSGKLEKCGTSSIEKSASRIYIAE